MDSTLRDGEQSPGVAITPDEKARYVEMAEEAGIRYIEIGFPHNPFDYVACKAAARAAKSSRLVAMALTQRESIDKVVDVGAQEVLFIVPCSESHLSAIFGGTLEELAAQLLEAIAHAHDNKLAVNIGLEDASQGDLHVIKLLLDSVRQSGVTVDCITIADTRGQMLPSETVELIRLIREHIHGLSSRVAFHAHNDLGLATANSIVALCADPGADCVHVTSCGFGERAGNASLEQVAVVLETKLARESFVDFRKLNELTSFVQKVFLTPIHPHAPVIGSKVFLHESGIHQKAMLNESRTFQFLNPSLFGRDAGMILGKHSGKRMREEIAKQAGCAEAEVARLQQALLSLDKKALEELFVKALRELYDQTFIGLSQDDAVKLLREGRGRADK
jgi:isopropylmalate/homocitrate/citramalate synthase